LSPVFAFTRELVNGRIRGLESSRISSGIDFRHELKAEEFKITDAMFKAFRDFVTAEPAYKVTAAMIDRNRAFVELELRVNIVTAAYGRWRKPWTFCQRPVTSPRRDSSHKKISHKKAQSTK
jgi:hypothetical protein